jgi:hypothetical protein
MFDARFNELNNSVDIWLTSQDLLLQTMYTYTPIEDPENSIRMLLWKPVDTFDFSVNFSHKT